MSSLFQIICVDNLIARKIRLQVGDNVIGNDIVKNDEPTLSKAINIQVTPDGQMSITPFKGVQCYIRGRADSNWRQLGIDTTYPLHLQDTCLLNPIKIWFRVISAMSENNNLVNKRLEESSGDEPPCKKPCSEIDNSSAGTGDNSVQDSAVDNEAHNNTPYEAITLQIKGEQSSNDTAETKEHDQIETKINLKSDENEQSDPLFIPNVNDDHGDDFEARILNGQVGDGDQALDIGNATGSSDQVGVSNATGDGAQQTGQTNNKPKYREKCKYGDTCYRINSEHRSQFSHPGDSDYNLIDQRPECEYGTACYRKNSQHKQDYKHTVRKPRKIKTTVARQLTPESDFSDEDSFTESIDESDYDPSFIDDDEYEIDY
ncbi:hypothetical protein TKK_0006039 [Trichogramma kaykai]